MADFDFCSIIERIALHAERCPDATAFTFLRDRHLCESRLDYAGLWRSASQIAAALRAFGCNKGDRALLVYPSGLDYVEALFGCLLAGVIAVPIYPPANDKHLSRLRAVIEDCRPSVLLTDRASEEKLKGYFANEELAACALPFLATDGESARAETLGDVVWPERQELALLQYTSGSTGSPKGVMISHGNLWDNQKLISDALDGERPGLGVSWLPLYHDMGLIGSTLQSAFWGYPCVFMSPFTFMQHPVSWLQAISKYGAVRSGAPNFAYELCATKIREEQLSGVDLSSWRVAFCGSEPIRASSLRNFADRFAAYGFDSAALLPCYGLAEATLFVSGSAKRPGARLHQSKSGSPEDSHFVGCGPTPSALDVQIIDPDSHVAKKSGEVGEIWVRGPNVALGYWNKASATVEAFSARRADAPQAGSYMRTGDLGFFGGDELVVTGRVKELLIIGGRNFYPHDLEATVETLSSSLRPAHTAAISVAGNGTDALAIVAEVERAHRRTIDCGKLATSIVAELTSKHGVAPSLVVFLAPGGQLKTTSGKIRRSEIKARLSLGGLDIFHQWGALPERRDPSAQQRQASPHFETEARNLGQGQSVMGGGL